jgi:gliding motility-associated-like protein
LIGHSGNIVKWQFAKPPFTPQEIWQDTILKTATLLSPALAVPTRFRAVVDNGVCDSVISTYVEITVVPYNGGSVSGGKTVCYGTSGTVLSLTGYNGTIVKWQSSTDPYSLRTDIPETTDTYITPAVYRTTWYWAVIQNGDSVLYSTPDSIVVNDQANAGSISALSSNIAINTSTTLNSSTITGTILRWESKTQSTVFAPIPNTAGLAVINTGNLNETTIYRMIVGNSPCTEAFSNEQIVNVFDVNIGILSANDSNICQGTPVTLTLSNSNGTVVGWENASSSTGLFSEIINLGNTFTATPSITTYYKVKVKMPDNTEAYTGILEIIVTKPPVAGKLLYTPNVCTGNDAGFIRIEGNTGKISNWEVSPDSLNWAVISSTSLTYNAGILMATQYYRVKVSNGECAAVYTPTATINVLTGPRIDVQVKGSNVCEGSAVTVTVVNKQPYVKYTLTDIMDNPVNASVDSTGIDVVFTMSSFTSGSSYAVMAGSSGCSARLSDVVKVSTIAMAKPIISGPQNVCPSDTTTTFAITQQSGHAYFVSSLNGIIGTISNLGSIPVQWTGAALDTLTVVDTLIVSGCVSKTKFAVLVNDLQLPVIQCASTIKVEITSDSIVGDVYKYMLTGHRLEPLHVSDDCAIPVVSNNVNYTSLLRDTILQIEIEKGNKRKVVEIIWSASDGVNTSTCKTSIDILINDVLDPMSAFSPNDDDANQYWTIKNIELFPDYTVRVYNRWGNVVYEKIGYDNRWDGTDTRGKRLPMDSYHYVLLDGNALVMRGIVTIVK